MSRRLFTLASQRPAISSDFPHQSTVDFLLQVPSNLLPGCPALCQDVLEGLYALAAAAQGTIFVARDVEPELPHPGLYAGMSTETLLCARPPLHSPLRRVFSWLFWLCDRLASAAPSFTYASFGGKATGRKGLGASAPILASLSASSLPNTFACPFTHLNVVGALRDRRTATASLITPAFATPIQPRRSQSGRCFVSPSTTYFESLTMWRGAKGGVFSIPYIAGAEPHTAPSAGVAHPVVNAGSIREDFDRLARHLKLSTTSERFAVRGCFSREHPEYRCKWGALGQTWVEGSARLLSWTFLAVFATHLPSSVPGWYQAGMHLLRASDGIRTTAFTALFLAASTIRLRSSGAVDFAVNAAARDSSASARAVQTGRSRVRSSFMPPSLTLEYSTSLAIRGCLSPFHMKLTAMSIRFFSTAFGMPCAIARNCVLPPNSIPTMRRLPLSVGFPWLHLSSRHSIVRIIAVHGVASGIFVDVSFIWRLCMSFSLYSLLPIGSTSVLEVLNFALDARHHFVVIISISS
ncbi:hypothetical protein VTO73DRAFT_12443 [Trametes versicolor]